VIQLRRMFRECIEAVQQGQDPVGVVRDPVKNRMITIVPGEIQVA
jgi:hypothetical protein